MRTTFHTNKDLTTLFSLKDASRATLSDKKRAGFVTSTRFPGVSWLKSLSKNERIKNNILRGQLVQRLKVISGKSKSLKRTGHTSKVLNQVIKMLSKESGLPLSTKYLTRLCSRATFRTGNAKEKWTSIKTTIIYKLLGGTVAGKYRDYVVGKAGGENGKIRQWWLDLKEKHFPAKEQPNSVQEQQKVNEDMRRWMDDFNKTDVPQDGNSAQNRISSIILED